MNTSIPTAEGQGAPPKIIIIDEGKKKDETHKEKEQEAIQTLINFPTIGTPIRTTQQPSTEAITLQFLAPGLSSTKVAWVLPYGDPNLDEEIVIPRYDYKTMNIDQINEVQEALEKKKKQEILINDYKQRQSLIEIKDIFLDAFSLQVPDEIEPIMEQLSSIVD